MKRAILMLTVVSLLAIPAMALKEYGDVPPPTDLTSSTDPGDPLADPIVPATITFDWVAGEGKAAEKYSLDVYGVVLVDGMSDNGTVDPADDVYVEGVLVEWSVSFGTSDYNPDNMSDPTITIPQDEYDAAIDAAIAEAIADQGIYEWIVQDHDEMFAKVKGLDPSDKNPKKRQNNEFSLPLDLLAAP